MAEGHGILTVDRERTTARSAQVFLSFRHYTYKRCSPVVSCSTMGLSDFFRSAAAIFRLAHKSDRDEFTLYLKLVALGVAVVGTIGFLIKLIGSIFFG